jgi:protein SCO1/2
VPVGDAVPTRGLPGRRVLLGLLVILVAAVVPAVFVPTLMCRPADPQLMELGEVPAFQLVDDRGEQFTEEALRGHPTIVNFIFTRCDTICPVVTAKMQKVAAKLADKKASPIKFLSISVDPTYDTPARLTQYAATFHADPARWRFLTGPADKVRSLVEGPFMNSMQREGDSPSGAPAISHSGYFLLVDGDLQIRGVYDSNDTARLDELMHHARFLARTHRSYKFGGGP